ncbi:MAG TPA: hypothetical protein VN256_12905 [Pyrinomonadaceae bacterium]|nr:hypothetical protein [Pyrinomonadaceae bacterium]
MDTTLDQRTEEGVRVQMACRECGNKEFYLLTVVTEVFFDHDAGTLCFKAPYCMTNLEEGFTCFKCNEPCDDFEGVWDFTATRL